MMKVYLNYKDIHSQFKLNGVSHDIKDLKEVAYSLIKEGDDYEKVIGDFISDWLDNKPSLEVQTSGSTGKPKTILLQKQHMVNSAMATGEFFDLEPGSTALLCLPANYIAGKMMIVRAMVLGLELDYVEPSSSPLQNSQKYYDFCAMVPMQLHSSLNSIEKIKKLLVGGSPVSMQLKNRVQLESTEVFETYGMTETITHVAVKKLNSNAARSSSHKQQTNQGNTVLKTDRLEAPTYFMALPNVTFSIDKRECLVIDAPKVSNDQVVTNDIVNLISEIQFEWLGRYDNVINSGGIKLFPEQIEAKLSPHINNRFFTAGLPDEKLGQKLILVVEGESNSEELFQRLKQLKGLEQFDFLKNIYTIPEFIETDSGKIQRKESLRLIKI